MLVTPRVQTRPSRLYLPQFDLAPRTIFEYLLARFPQVKPTVWDDRVTRGQVTLSDGTTVCRDSPYRPGAIVFYRKEVPGEPVVTEQPRIAYRNDEILVVDKPHGMPVTPTGDYLERSLLIRLQRITDLPDLAPMHRLDRDTAGLLLFAIKRESRPHYHRLFEDGKVVREYLAVAHAADPPSRTHWYVENRMEPGDPWYRQRIVDGPANAGTDIELVGCGSGRAAFRLFPKTGRKHQLRVHMESIGYPIVGDPFYPTIMPKCEGDLPMQLLARRLEFSDPLTGEHHSFVSSRTLTALA